MERIGLGAKLVLAALVLAFGTWAALFAFHRVPGGAAAGWTAAFAVAALSVAAAATLAGLLPFGRAPAALFALVLAGILAWWALMTPRNDRDWEPDVSRPVTAAIGPDRIEVRNVRDFDWRTETDFTPRWDTRSYDLADLRTLDVINSYWAGPVIAHTLLSFGFTDGRFLAFSIEIRREKGEAYSDLAGFLRQYEVVHLAADERDIVRLRTNVRGEDARLFRIKADPAQVRGMLLGLLRRANDVAAHPAWYNSLLANCTTEMFGAAREAVPGLPFDWRLILSGYLPDYLYDQGLVDRRLSLPALREGGAISERGRAADRDPAFSSRIRDGIPDPAAALSGSSTARP